MHIGEMIRLGILNILILIRHFDRCLMLCIRRCMVIRVHIWVIPTKFIQENFLNELQYGKLFQIK